MKLDILIANPAGNITAFVLTDIPKNKYAQVAAAILSRRELKAEQVAFRCGENRIEMAGGEFCGNACRAFAMLLARERGLRGAHSFSVEISGCDRPVSVSADTDNNTAFAEMPLPVYVGERSADGISGTLVHLGGIAHFVVEGIVPSMEFFEQAEHIFDEFAGLEAYGVIFLEKNGSGMTPLVKVPAAGSLVWEGSCGSGSLACAVARSIGREGRFIESYTQPAGDISVEILRKGGEVVHAFIGGTVQAEKRVELDLTET